MALVNACACAYPVTQSSKKIPFQNIIKFLHILSQSYIFGGDSRLRVIKYFQILCPTELALSMNGR